MPAKIITMDVEYRYCDEGKEEARLGIVGIMNKQASAIYQELSSRPTALLKFLKDTLPDDLEDESIVYYIRDNEVGEFYANMICDGEYHTDDDLILTVPKGSATLTDEARDFWKKCMGELLAVFVNRTDSITELDDYALYASATRTKKLLHACEGLFSNSRQC